MDVCLAVDPRIKRIKQEEREAKAKRKGKAGTPQSQKAKEEEDKKKAEEEAKRKEEEEKVREIAFLLSRPASRCPRLPGSRRRKIKPRPRTQRRRPAGQHEPRQISKPPHNARPSSPSSNHTNSLACISRLEMGMALCFPWFISNLPSILAWGSVLGTQGLEFDPQTH